MKNLIHTHYRTSMVGETLLPALSILFGLQLLRILIPQLVWLFGDRFGMNAPLLGMIAIAVFAASYLTGLFRKCIGNRNYAVYAAVGLGFARLLVQIPWPEPMITLLISMAGTILFGLFISSHTDEIRFRGKRSTANLAVGLLSGFILDTALHGAFGTYDIVWRSGIWPIVLTVVLVLLLWIAARSFSRTPAEEEPSAGITWPWLAIGPFIFLQLVVFQNIARYTVVTGWDQPYVFGWILITQIAGLTLSIFLIKHARSRMGISIVAGIILIVGTAFPFPENAWTAAALLLSEQLSISVLITLILTGSISGTGEENKKSINAANGTGFLLLGIISVAYYTVYQINLPYENQYIEPLAAIVIALCAIVTGIKASNRTEPIRTSWIAAGLSLVLLTLPLAGIIARFPPVPVEGTGYPVTFMTYNLHNGFNPKGDLDLEALAKVIEEEDPDIVVLQEISRGWLINGRVDMMDWLSQRLEMPYVSAPTEGPLWGNAILSRYPVIESVDYELPPRDLFLRRGVLVTLFDIGNDETLQVMATHLHHIPEDSEIRQQQIPVILENWDGAALTVLSGDMNAHDDSPEMGMLRDAGLVDVMADTTAPENYTFNSVEPFERIDYIWITPDLTAANVDVIQVSASDHMPVIVELSR